jgi:hypothetical protein
LGKDVLKEVLAKIHEIRVKLGMKILYQRGNCFNELVERMRSVTKKLGTRRVNLADGSWYWELKPSWKPGELIEVAL